MNFEKLFLEGEKKALLLNLADKYFYSGYCYYFGIGRLVDKDKAISLYLEGCKKDNPKCLYSMGVCSEKQKKDFSIAYEYYKKAFSGLLCEAQRNDSISQRMVSCYYLMGNRGVQEDITKATYWVRKAALLGNPEAEFDLGESYYNGKGVLPDHIKAKYWLERSINHGFNKAVKFLEVFPLDISEKSECLNLCDIALLPMVRDNNFSYFDSFLANSNAQRVYLGSYFCSKYVKHLRVYIEQIVDICKKYNKMVTFVIPIISQIDLQDIKEELLLIASRYVNIIDEVCVNDFAMLSWVGTNLPFDLCMGRMFMKDPRDQRIPESRGAFSRPLFINNHVIKTFEQYPIINIEIDQIYNSIECENIPPNISLSVHDPYCYQTVGQLCLYASLKKSIEKKFRPNDNCALECMYTYLKYNMDEGSYIRFGRAVYYKPNHSIIKSIEGLHIRTVQWPVDTWEERYEYSSSTER